MKTFFFILFILLSMLGISEGFRWLYHQGYGWHMVLTIVFLIFLAGIWDRISGLWNPCKFCGSRQGYRTTSGGSNWSGRMSGHTFCIKCYKDVDE